MFPYCYSLPSDTEYLRALAEERAAREQYVAARRAQEEARLRAARARTAQRAYSPYSSYHDDTYDLDDNVYLSREPPLTYNGSRLPFTYSLNPYQQHTLMEEHRHREILEEQRRRELLELERQRLKEEEEERILRILREERQREEAARRKEEERLQRAMEEDKSGNEPDRALQQASLEPLLRALGFVPKADIESHMPQQQSRSRRANTSQSPIRPFPFGQASPAPPAATAATAATKVQSSSGTTIPISSPKATCTPTPAPTSEISQPTAEQIAAAEKIQEAFRAHTARKQALTAISRIRKHFINVRSTFVLPTTLDYDIISTNGRIPTTVTVNPAVTLPSPYLESTDPFEGVPKLAYTSTNTPLHAYQEQLNRILHTLDEIESHGDMGVRAARRELARTVEREAERVDRWSSIVWSYRVLEDSRMTDEPTDFKTTLVPCSNESDANTCSSAAPSQDNAEVDSPNIVVPSSERTSSESISDEPEHGLPRPPTPALMHCQSDMDDMDIEPDEADTPPPSAAADEPTISAHEGDVPQPMQKQDEEQKSLRSAPSLVDSHELQYVLLQ